MKYLLSITYISIIPTVNEAYKIFKFQSPTVLFINDFIFSKRDTKGLFAITPQPTSMYTYEETEQA